MDTLFHVTTSEVATLILRDGFRESHSCYMTATEHQGVWLSDHVLDANEDTWGDTVLAVKFVIPLAALADYEWIEEGKGYREWLVPARLVQEHATVSMSEGDVKSARGANCGTMSRQHAADGCIWQPA